MAHTHAVTIFGPDFPFDYRHWLTAGQHIGRLPDHALGTEVAVIGAGISGLVAAYELMRLGLKPVVYEAERLGGRLRSEPFTFTAEHAGRDHSAIIAELGGMRFPVSSTTLFHYLNLVGLETKPFPNPLTEAAGSTVIDLGGDTWYARSLEDLPPFFAEVAEAWDAALEREFGLKSLQEAIKRQDATGLKAAWNQIVAAWDDKSFYEFVTESEEFSRLSYRHREVFGQVGFGTGGWDSDFANSMLEILRVVLTECDSHQHLVIGGSEQLPRRLWERGLIDPVHWSQGTSLAALHDNRQPRGAVSGLYRDGEQIVVTEATGSAQHYDAVVVTCQSWLLTTEIDCAEDLFSQEMWMALDRTRYMQSSKTFVPVDRPFWKDQDPATGQDVMSMTLTDRITRGTYLFDHGDDQPGVICLTYSWMSDALKMLPYDPEKRAELALGALEKIYPTVDIRSHIIGEPVTVSWEANPYFLGAFKGALPGHYRYNHRMYGHFVQDDLPASQRGIFLAGDSVSFTPAWAEGAVQSGLNAVWGVLHHFGGTTDPANPGPGDLYEQFGPLELAP
ncbi:NAD(P)/FAD-dependent oxidoreductase [Auritidibacter ignavus]|uniref:flavin monoamine oxidase family protein n=1 Tax=Auritidibacter ignavus TaxID=678932 RepID=UPI00244BB8BF|nr:NAD(P)/FAD-dependent oxidoreductase [Auritidibacter ignavus]WGH90408.1 NAD(P)/FAD-dependent oxidoreductase [Auritidibacter ignavus]